MHTRYFSLFAAPVLLLALAACSSSGDDGATPGVADGSTTSGDEVDYGFDNPTSVDSGPCQYLDVSEANAATGAETPFAWIQPVDDTSCGYFAADAVSVVSVTIDADGLGYDDIVGVFDEAATDVSGIGDRASCSEPNSSFVTEFRGKVLNVLSAGTTDITCDKMADLAAAIVTAAG